MNEGYVISALVILLMAGLIGLLNWAVNRRWRLPTSTEQAAEKNEIDDEVRLW